MMALRAMANRIREADVRGATGIQAFANRQANEIRLTAPQQVEVSSPDVTLGRLFAALVLDASLAPTIGRTHEIRRARARSTICYSLSKLGSDKAA
jgi:hypothetical protein